MTMETRFDRIEKLLALILLELDERSKPSGENPPT